MKKTNFTPVFFIAIVFLFGIQGLISAAPNPPEVLPAAPTENAADVLSIYGGHYSNVTSISSFSGTGDVKEERTVLGDNMIYIENGLNGFANVHLTTPVDIDTYNMLVMDLYVVTTAFDLKVSLADGSSTFNIRVNEGWNKIQIDLMDYKILASPPDMTSVASISFVNNAGYTRSIYVTNIYASKVVHPEQLIKPATAGNLPTKPQAAVIPIFSDQYSNEIGMSIHPDTPGSPKKFKGFTYPPSEAVNRMAWLKDAIQNGNGGFPFNQPVDVSTYDSLHISFFLDGTSFPMRFRFGIGTGSIAPNPGTALFTAQPGWNYVKLNLADFVALSTGFDLTTMNGFGMFHRNGYARTIYIDEVYFSKIDFTSENASISDNLSVRTFPNPAIEMVTIESSAQIKMVDMFNMAGQHVKSIMGKGNRLEINLQDQTKGIYLLQIHSIDGAITTKRFIKM